MKTVKRVRNRGGSMLRCVLAFALAFAMMGVATPGALADEGTAREQNVAQEQAAMMPESPVDAAVASVDGAETADAEEDVAVGETEAVVEPPSAIKEAQTADDSEVAAAQDVLSAGVQVMAPPNTARNQYILYNACMGTNGHQCFIIQPLVNGTAALGGNWQATVQIDNSITGAICLWPANGAEQRFGDIGFRQTLSLDSDSRYVKIVFDIVNYGAVEHEIDLGILKKNDYFKEMRETSTGAYGIFDYGGKSYIYNFAVTNSYGLGKPDVLWFSPTNFGTNGYWPWQLEGSPETGSAYPTPALGKDGDPGWEVGLTWLDRPLAPGGAMQLAFEIGACGYGVQPELSSDIEAVVKGGRIDISAEVKDSEGALDRLLCVTDPYTADAGAIKEIGRAEGTGEFVPLDGTFPLPPTWNVGEVHAVEMWVENDAGAGGLRRGRRRPGGGYVRAGGHPHPRRPRRRAGGKEVRRLAGPGGQSLEPRFGMDDAVGPRRHRVRGGRGIADDAPGPCPLWRFRRRAAMHKWRVLREIPGNPPLVHCRGMVAGRMPASRCRRWLQRIPGLSLRFARLPQKREGVKAENPPGARLRCF